MNPVPWKNPAFAALSTCLLLAGLLVGACGNDQPAVCDLDEGLGVLEGYLYELGQGVSAEISARALEGPQPGRIVHRTVSDSTGWYSMELATGLYELEVKPRGFRASSSELYDRIRVLPRVFRFDIRRGRASVRVGLPPELEGEVFTVQLWSEGNGSFIESGKVADGWLVVDFPLILPVAYAMSLGGGGLAVQEFLPGALRFEDADLLLAGTESLAAYEVDFRDSYSSISGSITGSWQQTDLNWRPFLDVFVPDSTRIGNVSAESDGSFTCAFTHPRTVLLRSGYRGVSRWIGGDSMADATVFELQPGDRITGVDLVESGLRVLLDGPGDHAYHRPTVTVRDAAGREHHPDTASKNPFWICNLGPGPHYLKIEGFCDDEPYAPRWFGGGESWESATPIDLAAGELRSITMVLQEGGLVTGTLSRADGTAPNPVDFGLFDAAGAPLCSSPDQWQDFDEGKFRFRGLADGAYFLAVQLLYDEPWWYPGTLDFGQAEAIVIENHQPVTELDWKLP